MPLYEFHCKHCGTDTELLVRTTGWKGLACPKCGADQLAKKLSVFAAAPASGGAPEPACAGPGPTGRCCGGGACGMN